VGLALEKMRFTRGKLTFQWSPDDEAFIATALSPPGNATWEATESRQHRDGAEL